MTNQIEYLPGSDRFSADHGVLLLSVLKTRAAAGHDRVTFNWGAISKAIAANGCNSTGHNASARMLLSPAECAVLWKYLAYGRWHSVEHVFDEDSDLEDAFNTPIEATLINQFHLKQDIVNGNDVAIEIKREESREEEEVEEEKEVNSPARKRYREHFGLKDRTFQSVPATESMLTGSAALTPHVYSCFDPISEQSSQLMKSQSLQTQLNRRHWKNCGKRLRDARSVPPKFIQRTDHLVAEMKVAGIVPSTPSSSSSAKAPKPASSFTGAGSVVGKKTSGGADLKVPKPSSSKGTAANAPTVAQSVMTSQPGSMLGTVTAQAQAQAQAQAKARVQAHSQAQEQARAQELAHIQAQAEAQRQLQLHIDTHFPSTSALPMAPVAVSAVPATAAPVMPATVVIPLATAPVSTSLPVPAPVPVPAPAPVPVPVPASQPAPLSLPVPAPMPSCAPAPVSTPMSVSAAALMPLPTTAPMPSLPTPVPVTHSTASNLTQ